MSAFQAQTPALASALVLPPGPNRELLTIDVVADATLTAAAWFVMIFDATAVPADGAVTPNFCFEQLTGVVQLTLNFNADGPRFQNGVVIVASTTGPFTKTASAHAFIAATYK